MDMPAPALSPVEADCLATLDDARAPLLAQIESWAAINSGSRNKPGLAAMAGELVAAFAPLGGDIRLLDPTPVDAVDATGAPKPLFHGQNFHLVKRPDAPVRVLLTGHMDTVFAVDHAFQTSKWLDADTLNGPGTADMKGGIAVMLAALKLLEASPYADALG